MSLTDLRRRNPVKQPLAETGLYHSFILPGGRVLNGAMDLDWLRQRLESFDLPDRLDGKRVLDIGPWDGFFTFEMERRGARVTAVDYDDKDTFRKLSKAFGSQAEYLRMDVDELSVASVGTFDIVLCLGVLYHLRYPLEALEKICSITTDRCIVETFVADGEPWLKGVRPEIPYAEFFERSELSGQFDNWWGPSVSAVEAWLRTAGFAWVELRRVSPTGACFIAHRRWQDLPPDAEPPVNLTGVSNHLNRGRTFRSHKEEYIQLWAEWHAGEAPALESVYPELDGLAAPPLYCKLVDGLLHVSVRVPPGMPPGRHEARLKIGGAGWSRAQEFFLDLPPVETPIRILSIQDGIGWSFDEVSWANDGWMTLWVEGLSAEADPGNVSVIVNGVPHDPYGVVPQSGQVNVQLRPVIGPGACEVRVEHRGVRSDSRTLQVLGAPPPIRGLESL